MRQMTYTGTDPNQSYAGGRQDVSGTVTSVIIRYVRNLCGDPGLARMLQMAGEMRPVEALEDSLTWSSYAETLALISAAAHVCVDNEIARHLGEEMLRQYDGTEVANLLRSLGSPKEVLKNVTAAAAKFFTISTLEALEVGDAHAIVRAANRPGYQRDIAICDFTKGLLSQVPVLFGLVPATIIESECSARGGRFCLYSVGWEEHQWSSFVDDRESIYTMAWGSGDVDEAQAEVEADESTQISMLNAQVQQLTERLQDVYGTAADLLATDDLDSVLSNVTRRAAHAVNAPRYLLAIQPSPDIPISLHHHGFTQREAESIALEVLQPNPDTKGGSRLIADVRSKRQYYGRIAAMYPEGVQFLEQEREALSVYANYAATALDMVTALDDARKSNATSSALLEFSRNLSKITTTHEVAKELSLTLPKVVGCDTSSVLLWDESSQSLRSIKRMTSDGQLVGYDELPETAELSQDGYDDKEEADANSAIAVENEVALQADTTNQKIEEGDETSGNMLTMPISASPVIRQLISFRDIIIVNSDTTDDYMKGILERYGIQSTLMAPIFTADKFLGVVTANFKSNVDPNLVNSKELRERIIGLSDQAAVSLENAHLLQQVSHMAWHDALTSLPNRRLLEDRANQALVQASRSGETLCMFFIDLDHFKEVNDVLGHASGDELIREVAVRLTRAVRQQDTVARLGGDEFAILLPGLSDTNAIEALAHRMLLSLSKPFMLYGQEAYVTGSIGIAIYPRDGNTYDELLSRADAAMYRSKGLGRNTFQVFDISIDQTSSSDVVQLERDLHKALENNQLFILYQPFIDLETAKVVGVESLVRWRHPTRGILEPATFIEMAEETDLIVDIDSWVVNETCKQARRWQDIGIPPLQLAINVSTRDLLSKDYVENTLAAIEGNALNPSLIELELTERVVFDDSITMRDNVDRLQKAGIRFSVDDFGTGASGLDRFGTFPISTLKIDRSFVQVLGPDDQSQTIVRAITGMANDLGMSCIAEGVETSTQSRVLLQRGCTTAQGFFFSPPLMSADVERMLTSTGGTVDVGEAGCPGEMDGSSAGEGSVEMGAANR